MVVFNICNTRRVSLVSSVGYGCKFPYKMKERPLKPEYKDSRTIIKAYVTNFIGINYAFLGLRIHRRCLTVVTQLECDM